MCEKGYGVVLYLIMYLAIYIYLHTCICLAALSSLFSTYLYVHVYWDKGRAEK